MSRPANLREFAQFVISQEEAGVISVILPEDLRALNLIYAYSKGYFPMPDPDDETIINWFDPDPRAILKVGNLNLGKSSRQKIRRNAWTYTRNQDFEKVMRCCADRKDTWITEAMILAYSNLHKIGFAYSFEVWDESANLIGGVYGVKIGEVFCAESMFRKADHASKAALMFMENELNSEGVKIIEVQFMTPFLSSIGVQEISKKEYKDILEKALPRILKRDL